MANIQLREIDAHINDPAFTAGTAICGLDAMGD